MLQDLVNLMRWQSWSWGMVGVLRGASSSGCVYVTYFSYNYVTFLPVVEWTLQDTFLSPTPGSSGLDMSQSADL